MAFSRRAVLQVVVGAVSAGLLGACADAAPTGVDSLARAESLTQSPHRRNTSSSPSSGSLLYCPSWDDERVRRTIGPEGGTVSVAGHSITLPPGAVKWPVEIRIRARESKYLEVSITADNLPSNQFEVPAQVTLSYARCSDAQASGLSAWYVDEATLQRLEDMGGSVDPANFTVTFPTGHLSVFALASN